MAQSSQSTSKYPFLAGGGEMGELTRNYDWASSPLGTPDQWPQSLRTTLGLLLHSAFPMLLFWGQELTCFYNDAFRPSLGHPGKHPALGKAAPVMWSDIWGFIGPLLQQVQQSGEPVYFEDQLVPFYRNGRIEDIYWTFSYSPAFGDTGQIDGVLVTCTETTNAVLGRRKLENSQLQVLALFEQSPVAIAQIRAPDLVFQLANPFYGDLVGRLPSQLVGNALLDALPELQGQGFDHLLRQVISTGIPYTAYEVAVELVRHKQRETIYVDMTYQPQGESNGAGGADGVAGVLVVCTDVTQQVLARQKLEEAESGLRVAIELAQLGTWSIDVATGGLTYSDRLIEWFGFDPRQQAYHQVIPLLDPQDQERIAQAVARALTPESGGVYDEIYTVIHPQTGQKRILHAHGKTVFDAQGNAIRLNGTAQDITREREIQLALEQQVQLRTQQLAVVNDQLAATNQELQTHLEEYAAINDQLAESNRLLLRSNDSLQQFAYVASHDLQEPLRKIQQFGELLKTEYADREGAGPDYIRRMQAAAGRMGQLIKDLLSFSRISAQGGDLAPVALDQVVVTVLEDLEVSIQEAGAVVEIGPLPVVLGDVLLLGQLFQNLLSNALKFRQPATPPHIRIRSSLRLATELPADVKPSQPSALYHQILVIDNGIGFDEQYRERIFEVFQRLHGKNQYAGTGIGLAICERVVANHGGAITASSQPGQGATFSIFLPV
ncbi:MAG: domain S-box protein [Spirosoma sp.]|nr:domain S-box protein [Spirosoma sp.]